MKTVLDDGKRETDKIGTIGKFDALSVGSRLFVTIDRLGMKAEGVAHTDCGVVFVPYALPGERVFVEISEKRASFARANIVSDTSVLGGESTAPDYEPRRHRENANSEQSGTPPQSFAKLIRTKPLCSLYGRCGGCHAMHMSYGAELEWKRNCVKDALERVGGFRGIAVDPVVGDFEDESIESGVKSHRTRYRNKATCSCSRDSLAVGFFEAKSRRVVNVADCMLQKSRVGETIDAIRHARRHLNGRKQIGVTDFVIRVPDAPDGGFAVALCAPGGDDSSIEAYADAILNRVDGVTAILADFTRESPGKNRRRLTPGRFSRAIYGDGHVSETIFGEVFSFSATSFFQVNTKMAQNMIARILQGADAQKSDSIIDLYCGVGTTASLLSREAGLVVGIESDEIAVRSAKENAKANGHGNVSFICDSVENVFLGVLKKTAKPKAVIIDPPRNGCGAHVARQVASSGAERVIYASCEPFAMARDLAIICADDRYAVTCVKPFDLFARTANIEVVVVLEKRGK